MNKYNNSMSEPSTSVITKKITFSLLNDILSRHKYYFHNLEFERGLGIIDDAFLLTLKSIDSSKVIALKIFTNLRCFYKGKVILRYHDLFLDQQMKKMTIKMYESQKEIEKSLLQLELDEINSYFANKIIHSISFFALW